MDNQTADTKCPKNTERKKHQSWLFNILIAVDQFGNTLAGGNPDATISARVGFFAHHSVSQTRLYWQFLEEVIDYSFYPIDGQKHCQWQESQEREIHTQGSDFMRALLGVFVIIASILIAPFTRIWVWLNPCDHHSEKIREKVSGELKLELKLLPRFPFGEKENTLDRKGIKRTFYGELEAISQGEILPAMTRTEDTVCTVSIEQVSGKLNGREGGFILQHSGEMDHVNDQFVLRVVSDSGTKELTGLAGTMSIKVKNGRQFYQFFYEIS